MVFVPIRGEKRAARFPVVSLFLLLLNGAVFLYELLQGPAALRLLVLRYGLIPYEVTHGVDLEPLLPVSVYVTLFSSIFLHGNAFHLASNMLYLWVFGKNVEDEVGRGRFAVFFVLCGLAAALVHVASDPASQRPTIGASGAVSGLLGAYLLLYPRARVLVFMVFGLVRMPAVVLLVVWVIVQVLNVSLGSDESVAWIAHIGGFIAGLLMAPLFRQKRIKD